jgi:uncharacterized membrane protein (UPF0127 family)
MQLRRLDDGAVVCEDCYVAERPASRMRGLLGRNHLPRSEGMLLRPAGSVHTFFMRFALDVVFLDWDLRVLRIVEHVRPGRAVWHRGAKTVLELRAGEARRAGIARGDRLQLVDANAKMQSTVAPPRPPRLVVASSDSRYLALARFLLAREGYDVDAVRDVAAADAALAQSRTEVVVVDSSTRPSEALRLVAAAETANVAVVVVGDTPGAVASAPVLPKWNAFDGLRAAIAAAVASRSDRETR